jgi:hypothetical protein
MKRSHLTALLLLTAAISPARADLRAAAIPSDFVGAWEEQGGGRLLNVEPGRVIERSDGRLGVRGLIQRKGNQITLRNMGVAEDWVFTLNKGLLAIEPVGRGKAKNTGGTFRRLDQVPPALKLEPLPVASPRKLSPEQIQKIQNEVRDRFQAEQALLKSANQPREKVLETQQSSLSYLTSLLADFGWTDARRFGSKTSVYVVIMAKHTHDLRLMMTLLPYAEKDLKNSGDGQTYAVLFDGLQLRLGKKQLYGTQVAKDEQGHPFVLPMQESKDQVNRRLVRMGLPDLDEYLAVVSQTFYPGQNIACCRQDG